MNLSIIIPVYNVEQYIDTCLYSIYSQKFSEEDFEVIVVNDGTPDNSMDIVKQYAKRYNNLRIVSQENQGLSVARNKGLSHAKGDYVWFVDSDDWLTKDALATICTAISENQNVDVFATILWMCYEQSGKRKIEYKPNPNVKSGRDYMFRNHNANRGACQRYILKRLFLEKHSLRFMPHVYHEDGEFSNRMLYLAERLIILPTPVYNYRIRTSGSIMSSRKMQMNYDLVKIFYFLRDFAEKYVKGNDDYWPYREKIFECLSSTIMFSRNEIFSKEFNQFYRENKRLIKQEARTILPHCKELTLAENIFLLQFSLFPKLSTQIKQWAKRILVRFRLYK